MKLKKLLQDLPPVVVKGSKEIEITGISSHSKTTAPGNLFIAKKGFKEDGSKYIPEAVTCGATAVLTDMFDPSFKSITQLIHPNIKLLESLLIPKYYQYPSHELLMVGITGTNGKTTSSFLIKHLLDQLYGPCGLIGTIEYIIGQHRYNATRTTPELASNHKMLREMLNQGCKSAVMEVTSHALDQGRVQHIAFDMAVFTNLTLDHLDYHKTMDSYSTAKQKLFAQLSERSPKKFPKCAVVNADSPWQQVMLQTCKTPALLYGIDGPADLMASDIQFSAQSTAFIATYQTQKARFHIPLTGRFNVYNCLAAISVGLGLQVPLSSLTDIFAHSPSVPGRLESVPNHLGLGIFVDFAHTDDALYNVLDCLQEIKTGKIITVFGCGGDRDRTKRPKMAQVAGELSDLTIVTSDNPRTEQPEEIARQIIHGFSHGVQYFVELDRHKAIEMAISLAKPNDIILIAGKGHEPYQVFSHKTVEFDDRKVAAKICASL